MTAWLLRGHNYTDKVGHTNPFNLLELTYEERDKARTALLKLGGGTDVARWEQHPRADPDDSSLLPEPASSML